MAEEQDELIPLEDGEEKRLRTWRQSDFTLDKRSFVYVRGFFEDGDLEIVDIEVEGWVVITQTCDIVNYGPGKDIVTICPIVKAEKSLIEDARRGRTPAAISLELAEDEDTVVDLGKTMSVHKKILTNMTRRDGYKDELGRAKFAEILERRYGRFAFPDDLSNAPLRALRNEAAKRHDKDTDLGKIYRSIKDIRLRASPGFEAANPLVSILLIVETAEMTVSRDAIMEEITKLADSEKFAWPANYQKDDPFITIATLDELSAREYRETRSADLDFLSNPKA